MFESLDLTDELITTQPGKRVNLSGGSVFYQLEGPERGELVILIHGMSIPSFVWDPTFEMLTNVGFHVLRYDLFGRGYSDRPKVQYNLDLYVRQLFELIEVLKLTDLKINIIGLSLGAPVCASFAVQYAKKVKSICFIDPTHPADMPSPPSKIYKNLIKFKFLAQATDRNVVEGLPNNFFRYEDFPEFEEQFTEQLNYKGYAQAIISTLIDFEFALLPEIYEQVGKLNVPICLFWGKEDQLARYETSDEFKRHIPTIQFHSIEKAGHLSHYERPDLVNPILLDFLKKQSGPYAV